MEDTITEQELENIFLMKKPKKKLPITLVYFLFFVVLFTFFYVLSNFPALMQKIDWWYKNEVALNQEINNPIVKSTNNGVPVIEEKIVETTEDNHIIIPKIGVNAPVEWNVKNVDSDMQKSLHNGVSHILGTALPGNRGNGFITGHSSNYLWAKGNYKTIFALLNKLVVGDQFLVKYQNQEYVYKIKKIVTVKPTDSQILIQNKKEKEFSLITCVPVGTSLYRLVLTGEQIYPK